MRACSFFLAVVCLGGVAACGMRPVKTPATVDGGTGGSIGTGGAGSGGRGGGSGGNTGTGGSTSLDGGINCAAVGCGVPPVCGEGCGSVCGCCPCFEGERRGDLVCRGGCYAPNPDASADVAIDGALDGSSGDGAVERAALCANISTDYAAALHAAQECTVGAARQCEMQVRSGFFCNCTTFANTGADTLAAIASLYQSSGCQTVCAGICVSQQSLTCLSDATSSTGGRCKIPGQLTLAAADNGGTFSVAVGDEVDITLESIAPGSYSTDVGLSSDLMTVLEVNIPASAPNPNGPTRWYRLRALSAGQVQIRIPFEPAASGTPRPPYAVTITAR